jgi:hypothetical protein
MPKQRNFDNLYKALNVKHDEETPIIPPSALPSNNCPSADHSICDELFEGYEDGKARLLWKGKLYRLDAEQSEKFRQMMLKDMEENDAKHNGN